MIYIIICNNEARSLIVCGLENCKVPLSMTIVTFDEHDREAFANSRSDR